MATIEADMDIPVEEGPPAEEKAAATKPSMARESRWTSFVHVGEGAEECPNVNEEAMANTCQDSSHFHAWVRLPNPYQHRDIHEKASAAKARRLRALRDPESDSHLIMESELGELSLSDPSQLVEELLSLDFSRDYLEAIKEVDEEERFENFRQDREELERLTRIPEEDRPAEEYEQLTKHVTAYNEAVNERLQAIQAPRRQTLSEMSMEALIDQVRKHRIEEDASEQFLHHYRSWMWFVCTFEISAGVTGRPEKRIFNSIEEMKSEPEQILEAISNTFTELERAQQEAASGNS